jgi:hypothetical protein
MDMMMLLYSAILFFVLTPGILVTIPPGGKPFMVAGVHAVVFGLIMSFAHPFLMKMY